jgi:ACS family allantoate permease-like MFS transporter
MADKTRQRIYWSIFALSIPILGFILMVTLPQDNLGGNLAAFYITSTASTAFTLVLSMISSNVAGQSKKSVVNAINLIGYCVGNLIGPQIISLENAPRYLAAKTIVRWYIFSLGIPQH